MSLLTLTTLQQQQREWNSIYCVICRRWSIHGHDTYTFSRQFHSLTQPRPLPAILYCAMAWNRGWLRQDLISHLPLPAFLLLFFRIHQPSLQEVLGEKGPKHHHKKRNQSHSKLRYLPAVQVLCIQGISLPPRVLIVVSEIKRTFPLDTVIIYIAESRVLAIERYYSSLYIIIYNIYIKS